MWLLVWLCPFAGHSQPGFKDTRIVSGQVVSTSYGRRLPFAIVQTWPGGRAFMANGLGQFTAYASPVLDSITVICPGHAACTLSQLTEETNVTVQLDPLKQSVPVQRPDLANHMIDELRSQRQAQWQQFKPFEAEAYTKLVIGADTVKPVLKRLKPVVKPFTNHVFNENSDIKKLIIAEQYSELAAFTPLRRQEQVAAVNLSGADSVTTPLPMALINSDALASDFVTVFGSLYANPLAGNPHKRYDFSLEGRYPHAFDTLYLIAFKPKNPRAAEVVHGYLVASGRNGRLLGIYMEPAEQLVSWKNLALAFGETDRGWQTTSVHGHFAYPNLFFSHAWMLVDLDRYLYNYTDANRIAPSAYVLQYVPGSTYSSDSVMAQHRVVGLDTEDTHTLGIYKRLGRVRYIDQLVSFSERLALGEFQLGRVRADLYHFLRVNYYEAVRLGIGLHYNLDPMGQRMVGGYVGFGLRDRNFKYGMEYQTIMPNLPEGRLHIYANNDLTVPGATDYLFESNYKAAANSAGANNNLFQPRFDITRQAAAQVFVRNFTFSQLGARVRLVQVSPQYDYRFQDRNLRSYGFGELAVEWRLAYGERLARFQQVSQSLGSRFPILLMQVAQGTGLAFGRNFNYARADGKIDWQARVLGLGIFRTQLDAGAVSETVPFSLLFSAKGSYRAASGTVPGTFETMGFNEFAASHYVHLFMQHQFPKIAWGNYPFRPFVTVLHNMGLGMHGRRGDHQGLVVNPYPLGYYESGMNIDNIYVFVMPGIDVGIGLGVYYRYGPYQRKEPSENLFLKLIYNISF